MTATKSLFAATVNLSLPPQVEDDCHGKLESMRLSISTKVLLPTIFPLAVMLARISYEPSITPAVFQTLVVKFLQAPFGSYLILSCIGNAGSVLLYISGIELPDGVIKPG